MVISRDARARIDVEIAKYPQRRGALLPALHIVQEEHGHVAAESARELAEIFGIRPIEVMEVVSFYNMFYATPQPRHHVYVCTNLPCSLRGARTLLRGLEQHLGVDGHGNTRDGRIHLGHEECLGACAYAPMMRVDERYCEDLDLEQARRIVDALE
ncbi:MAG TPA: NADH-quinone oxidoreductase subunit NuoE [Myxococcota bacterium]|nr:NADH-quinone oxidoreductase subunit NuoE [Myxococcota bacterium]